MASNTPNLGLYKKDPTADGTTNFNVKTMMNDNWDIIDTKTGALSSLNTSNKNNLVAAINEAFQFANNGKSNVANAIGSPATTSDTFTQLQTHIQNSKNTLATNLTAKGQAATGTETLSALVAKVANVNTGRKFAIGTVTASNFNIEVRGLDFQPSYVIAKRIDDITTTHENYTVGARTTLLGAGEDLWITKRTGTTYGSANDGVFYPDGFSLNTDVSSSFQQVYIAFE